MGGCTAGSWMSMHRALSGVVRLLAWRWHTHAGQTASFRLDRAREPFVPSDQLLPKAYYKKSCYHKKPDHLPPSAAAEQTAIWIDDLVEVYQ